MESDEFVRMILTDACFIIEYFLLWLDKDYCWHSKLWSMADVKTDFILLENQLPCFFLQDLFDLTFPHGYNARLPFEYVTFAYFYCEFMHNIVPNEKLRGQFTYPYFVQHHLPRLPDGTLKVYHLWDMLRIFYVRLDDDQLRREHNGRELKPVYSASKLHDAGIEFEVNEDEISLLNWQYSKGMLKIPRIIVNDQRETQLRNAVAFEHCHFRLSRSMTDYIIFLENLIRTGNEVELLGEKGIAKNFFGENDAVASITKKLARHTIYTHFNN